MTLWAFYWLFLPLLPHFFVLAAPGTCSYLSSEQMQSLPGWPTLKTAVEENYSSSPYKVVTNDKAFPKQPASLCGGIAKGWVWFEYHMKVKGHYKWSFEIEAILPDVTDRKLPDAPRQTRNSSLRRAADFSDL
ncbi:hypothetical protein B0H10DRAFT_2017642 [Mycena sp. CBHHK59/15]|nr:hypothetical protein B0H10DRAFT_2017642 [Mycena sp. CBHHK59/15]